MKTTYQQPETIIMHTHLNLSLCAGSEGGTGGSGGDNLGGSGGGGANPWEIGRAPVE